MGLLLRALTVSLLAALAALESSASSANLQEARPAPDWFTRGVMYQVQPRAFTPEGTLKSIEARLPYLKDLGVTIVYLVPVFEMDDDRDQSFWSPRQVRSGFDNPKNQYRIRDYFHVDPEYGTDRDLRDLVAAAHRLGMKVIFDLVYFHAGPAAKVWREHPEFTRWNPDGTIAKGQWRFPRFDFRVPGVREYLWDNMVGLIRDFDADGYRCDIGDAMPLDFWCEGRRRMDAVKRGTILLCEGYDEKDQETAFDADYGWFPASAFKDAASLRKAWEHRDLMSTQGARFVNHYENHDIATDLRPRREAAWGHDAVDQTLVWMFTADGVPMLFTGNEIADADAKHSMFGKTPMDWSQLNAGAGKARHAFVKELARLRAAHPAFTDFNGKAGLAWLDATHPESVTAFVRRAQDGRQIVVVQNWTDRPVETEVGFSVRPDDVPDYLEVPRTDRSVKGRLAGKPLLSRRAERTGDRSFKLGGYGFAVYGVEPPAAETFPFVIGYDPPAEIVSMRSLLAAPAGRDGRVRARDGHFATDSGPIRFNAINLTGSANLPTGRFADRMADRLAAFGINCVRLHFLDSPRGYGTFMLPKETCLIDETDDPFAYRIDPGRLDRLEYLIAAFKRRGIYVNLNLHVARFMYAGKKGLTWLDRGIIESEKRFAREFLTHRNPHTGMTLAEDPVVAMIEFNNEDAPFNDCAASIAKGKEGFPAFIADCERRYLEEMRAFVRDELKCPAPLAGTQVTYTSAHVQSCLDYFDAHEYWCHPSPVSAAWQIADLPQVNYPRANCIAWLASRRVRGRPFTVSEYNNPYPNRYGAEGQPLLHAYGAYQGWDGLFAYSYDNRADSEPDHVEYFFSLVARADVLAHLPACAAMYLRGDVKRAGRTLAVGATREDWLRRHRRNGIPFDDVTQASEGAVPYGAGLVAGLDFVLEGGERPEAVPELGDTLVSDTRELEWNVSVSNAGYVVVRSANTKLFTGFVRGRTFDLGDGVSLAVGETERDWATASLVSKDANGFGREGEARILLAVTGQARNTGAKFTEYPQPDGTLRISTRGADWGKGPFLLEGVPATVTLPAKSARCWALDERGVRKASVPVRPVAAGVEVTVGPACRTVWYEIVAAPAGLVRGVL